MAFIDQAETTKSEDPAMETVDGNAELVTLWQVLAVILRRWKMILASIAVVVVLVTLVMVLVPQRYSAFMVVTPVNTGQSSNQFSALANSLGGFGSLNFSSLLGERPPVSNFTVFVETLHSVQLAGRLESRHSVLRKIKPALWDTGTGTWRRPAGLVFAVKSRLFKIFNLPGWAPPSLFTLVKILEENLLINEIGDTGLIRIEFQNQDSVVALQVLSAIYNETEALLRERAQARASLEVDYLTDKLRTVNITAHRNVLTELLASREQTLLLSFAGSPFAADAIQPPVVDPVPVFPRPLVFFVVAIIAGIFTGVAITVFLEFRPRWNL